jgi:predicted DNA-binding transcriptional regulator YafY
LIEQLRSGSVQLAAAAETVQEALDRAQETKEAVVGEELEALLAAIELLDSAGLGLAQAAAEAPTQSQVAADFAHWDDDRKSRIVAANDAYYELKEALGLIESQEPNYAGLAPVADVVSLAMGDVRDGIVALGGKVDVPSEEGD